MSKCIDMSALGELKVAKAYECETCRVEGKRWVHLRTCQTCGVTLCCDTSPEKHMTAHFRKRAIPSLRPPSRAKSGCGATRTNCLCRFENKFSTGFLIGILGEFYSSKAYKGMI